jgi:hypothetical protein
MTPISATLRRTAAAVLAGVATLSVVQATGTSADATGAAAPVAPRVGAPSAPGGVALTWSPAYMTDSHAFTAAQAQTMARRFDLVAAMPVAFQKYSAAMRETNPNISLLAYANATLASVGNIEGLPESAFAHDGSGRRIVSPDWNEHLMESSSPAWRERADWMCTDRAKRGGYDGCLVDMLTLGIYSDSGLGGGVPVNPDTHQPYTQAEYRQQMIELAGYYQAKSPQLTHVGNSVENAYRYWQSPVASRPLANSQPGAQMEDFLRGAFGPVDKFPSAADWVRNIDVIRDMEDKNTVGLFSTKLWVSASDAQVKRWQSYAMASFLMGADGGSYFSFVRSRNIPGVLNANVPYTMPKQIGDPRGEMTRLANGAWTRAFTNGMSVVNPTTSTATVDLASPMRTLSGRTVTSVTLAPNTGEVLVGAVLTPPTPVTSHTGRDTRPPAVTIRTALVGSRALRYAGVSRDNVAVARVMVAVRSERTGKWRHADGTWGAYRLLPAATLSPGHDVSRWSKRVLVRKPGRYGISVVSVDRSGNKTTARPWRVVRFR